MEERGERLFGISVLSPGNLNFFKSLRVSVKPNQANKEASNNAKKPREDLGSGLAELMNHN